MNPELQTEAHCKALGAYETDEWAAHAILEVEGIRGRVLDPCAGFGMLGKSLVESGYGKDWFEFDIEPWWDSIDRSKCRYRHVVDFLTVPAMPYGAETILMNPPFHRAVEFVEHAHLLGAKKIIAFQRSAWWESGVRTDFWRTYPPNRVYACRKRATCMRFDIQLGVTERPLGNTPTPHSWFVWERGHPLGTVMGHV